MNEPSRHVQHIAGQNTILSARESSTCPSHTSDKCCLSNTCTTLNPTRWAFNIGLPKKRFTYDFRQLAGLDYAVGDAEQGPCWGLVGPWCFVIVPPGLQIRFYTVAITSGSQAVIKLSICEVERSNGL